MSTPDPQARPVIGHHAGWGMAPSRTRIEPYKFTEGSIDTMCVRVREKIDVHGVGVDVVDMEGTFTVRRDDPCAVGDPPEVRWGESCVQTEFRSLELAGDSPLFGTVRVHLDPGHSSHGQVGPSEDGSLAASCVAHCFPIVELPELEMRLSTQGKPVTLASKVVQIPPVGDVARSDNSAELVDEYGTVVGEIVSSDIEVGDVVCSVPLGNTRPRSEPPPVHEHGEHEAPSGPGFYAEPPDEPMPGHTHEAGHTHDQGDVPDHEHGGAAGAAPSAAAGDLGTILGRLEGELRALVNAIQDLEGQQ